ncbi:MAG: hypothetical protein JW755_11000 [Candidatus Aminicenantes bacterium]|nr:hypothetical protein [Candidatus Aminicenantes bacterium]
MKAAIKKVFRILSLVLTALVVMIVTARVVSDYFMQRRVANFIENMQAKGKTLDIKDFNVPCRDENNAALPWRKIESVFFLAEDESELLNSTYLKIMKKEPLSIPEKAGIRKIIANNEASFLHFSEVLSRPCFNYVHNWDVPAIEMEIPKAVKMFQMMKLTCLDMYLLAQEGQFEGLMERWRTNYTFSQKISKEPFLISFLIGMAMARGQIELLKMIVSPGAYDLDTYQRIINQLDPSLWRTGFLSSLESERAIIFDCYKRMEKNDTSLFKEFYGNPVLGWLAQPILKIDFMYAMNFMDEAGDLIRKHYFESKNEFTDLNKRIEKLSPWHVFSLMLVPNFESAFLKEQVLEANTMVAAAGTACNLFYLQHGFFPENLSLLVPEFLPGIPLDPFSGRPLIYENMGTGFKIYSVGSNMKDDIGAQTWEINQLVAEKDDDWVWEEKIK